MKDVAAVPEPKAMHSLSSPPRVREGLAFSSGLRSSPPKLLAASEAPASAASFSPVHVSQVSVQDAAHRALVSAPRGGLKKPQPIVPAECNQPAGARHHSPFDGESARALEPDRPDVFPFAGRSLKGDEEFSFCSWVSAVPRLLSGAKTQFSHFLVSTLHLQRDSDLASLPLSFRCPSPFRGSLVSVPASCPVLSMCVTATANAFTWSPWPLTSCMRVASTFPRGVCRGPLLRHRPKPLTGRGCWFERVPGRLVPFPAVLVAKDFTQPHGFGRSWTFALGSGRIALRSFASTIANSIFYFAREGMLSCFHTQHGAHMHATVCKKHVAESARTPGPSSVGARTPKRDSSLAPSLRRAFSPGTKRSESEGSKTHSRFASALLE